MAARQALRRNTPPSRRATRRHPSPSLGRGSSRCAPSRRELDRALRAVAAGADEAVFATAAAVIVGRSGEVTGADALRLLDDLYAELLELLRSARGTDRFIALGEIQR